MNIRNEKLVTSSNMLIYIILHSCFAIIWRKKLLKSVLKKNKGFLDTGRAAVAGSSWLTGGREGGSSGSFNAGYGVTPTSAWNIGYAPMDQQYRRY